MNKYSHLSASKKTGHTVKTIFYSVVGQKEKKEIAAQRKLCIFKKKLVTAHRPNDWPEHNDVELDGYAKGNEISISTAWE